MTDPNKVISFAKQSWKELKPEDDYDVKLQVMPEVIKKHEDMVRCYLENDFNPERAIRMLTRQKQGMADQGDDGQVWHKRLSECLKRISRRFDKSPARFGK